MELQNLYPNFKSSIFHEMVHSTGHKDRLDREGVTGKISFGSQNYSKEELIAELGASMLCGVTGIENQTIDNSASYIQIQSFSSISTEQSVCTEL
ncbi:hypothetical protein LF822_17395 [Halobacillus sp. A5]|nr:hypothetical protein [Halobacillus sp. A5]